MSTSHDKLFKTAFAIFLKDLVELADPELAAALDLDRYELVPPELFTDFRKQGHVEPDLVAKTRTRDGAPRLVLVHVDVEGRFRRAIDERMRRYAMHLGIQFRRPVVSLVVFLRGGPPGVEVRELVESVGAFEVWRFRYLAFGLSRCRAEDYLKRPQPLAAALAALMRSKTEDQVERRLQCLRSLRRGKGLGLSQRFVLGRIVETYVELDAEDEERYAAELERLENKEVHAMVVTWEEALAESRAQGEAQGLFKATQEAILLVGRRRFAPLPEGFEERLQAIEDRDRLQRIFEQILDAQSIDDLDLG